MVDLVTNVMWLVWKIRDHPIGHGKYLPGYIVDNTGITPLDRDIRSANKDKLCLNEGLLKTEREPHGITKMSHRRMRALDTAESNAITT